MAGRVAGDNLGMPNSESELLISTSAAARILGLCSERVRQMDAELEPLKTASGHRLYSPERVRALAEQRAAKRGGG